MSNRHIGTDHRLESSVSELEEANWKMAESVLWARSKGYTWQDIADVIGGTRQAAQQRFGQLILSPSGEIYKQPKLPIKSKR